MLNTAQDSTKAQLPGRPPAPALLPPLHVQPSALVTLVYAAPAVPVQPRHSQAPLTPATAISSQPCAPRLAAGQSLHLAGDTVALQVADKVPINTGESHEYCVRAKGGAVSITLVGAHYLGWGLVLKV